MDRRALLRAALGLGAAAAGAGVRDGLGHGVALAREADRLAHASAADPSPNVCLQWNSAAVQAVRMLHPAPTVTARALAIAHTCMYDAWAAYAPAAVGTRLGGVLRRPEEERTRANKSEAVSYAAYRALRDLFPSQEPAFTALITGLGYDPADTSTDMTTPSGIGNVAAAAVLAVRHGDGANQLGDLHPGTYSDYTGYAPVNTPDTIADPGRWQPLRVPDGQGGSIVQQFTTPQWGRVAPFALASGDQLRPPAGPAAYRSDAYVEQAQRILRYSAYLDDRRKVIAEYWRDGPTSETPPGHWLLFAQFVSVRDGHDLDDDITLFFALANALLDAGIAVWDVKRAFDAVRPLTAIHYLFRGRPVTAWGGPYKGTTQIAGEAWQPYQPATVVTPPFPEFASGHSAFSRAGAEVLRRFTGGDAFGASYTKAAGTSDVEPAVPGAPYAVPATDVTLSWATFREAADQAGLSRRYGGIHFAVGDLAGRDIGARVGAEAWRTARGYIDGTA